MTRLAAGVYSTDGELRLVVSELLEAAGYPDTEENTETVVRAALDTFATLDIPIEFAP
jgi:hypothetical protein